MLCLVLLLRMQPSIILPRSHSKALQGQLNSVWNEGQGVVQPSLSLWKGGLLSLAGFCPPWEGEPALLQVIKHDPSPLILRCFPEPGLTLSSLDIHGAAAESRLGNPSGQRCQQPSAAFCSAFGCQAPVPSSWHRGTRDCHHQPLNDHGVTPASSGGPWPGGAAGHILVHPPIPAAQALPGSALMGC